MEQQVERSRSRPPIVRRAFAGLVLVVAAVIIVKIAIGMIMAVFWTLVAVAAVVAVLWALKTLIW